MRNEFFNFVRNNSHSIVEFYLCDAFEIYHFLPLYRFFEVNNVDTYFIAEPIRENTSGKWFDYKAAIKILKKLKVKFSIKCNQDCKFAVTTQDVNILSKYKNKKVHLCYGTSLTSYSFCESQKTIEGFDLKLIHGEISYNFIKENNMIDDIKILRIGFPRYNKLILDIKDLQEEKIYKSIIKKNVYKKPMIVYYPTWDVGSSIKKYQKAFMELKKNYFIITKAHHCTYRLESEREHRDILEKISDVILEGNFSFKKSVDLADIVVCDAISGAASEIPYIRKDIKLVLLLSPVAEKNRFKIDLFKYAYCADSDNELVENVKSVENIDKFIEMRQAQISLMYDEDVDEAYNELLRIVNKEKI